MLDTLRSTWLLRRLRVALRPVWLVLLLCSGLLPACGSQQSQAPITVWENDRALVQIEFRDDARAVVLLGDFNDWSPRRHLFTETEPGRWTCTISVPPGRYAYLIGVETDTGWSLHRDQANSKVVEDAAGRSLSLLEVKAP